MIQNKLLETIIDTLQRPFQIETVRMELLNTIGILVFEKSPSDYSIIDLFVEMKGYSLLKQLACNSMNEEMQKKSESLCIRIENTLKFTTFM